MDKNIVFLVTREVVPNGYYVWLAEELGKYLRVYVMSDNDKPYQFHNATYLHVSDEECLQANYKYCVFNKIDIAGKECPRHVTAWDKMLYYLNKGTIEYEYLWIIEDDVYIHSAQHALKFIERFNNTSVDYVAKDFFNKNSHPGWVQWYVCEGVFDPAHWYGGFTPLCRLSKKLVQSCDILVKEKGCLALVEALFPSLCAKHNLTITTDWIQTQPIRVCPDVSADEIRYTLQLKPDTIFHPCELSDEEKFALMKEITVTV